jgi:hypothetical protein
LGGRQRAARQRAARDREEREEGGRRRLKKMEKEKEKKKKRREIEKERKSERTQARFAVGGRAWATGSRAARDGTVARKKREGYGQRKEEKKRWNDN